MTLAIGLEGKDFVVIGADRQKTRDHLSGLLSTQFDNKIHEINRHAAFSFAGPEDGYTLFRAALRQAQIGEKLDEVELVEFGKALRSSFGEFQEDIRDVSQYHFLIVGFDPQQRPAIYSFTRPVFRPQRNKLYWSVGASGQAQYFLSRCYQDNLSKEQLSLLCYFCTTQEAHLLVGGGADIAIIDRERGFDYIETDELALKSEAIARLIQRQFQK